MLEVLQTGSRSEQEAQGGEPTMIRILNLYVILTMLACSSLVGEAPVLEKQVILRREAASGAWAIPKAVITPDGSVLIVAQDREGGDWGSTIVPIGIRSTDGGRTWGQSFNLVPEEFLQRDQFHMKPTGIVVDHQNHRIHLFISRSPLRDRQGNTIQERWFYTHIQETHELGRAWFHIYSDNDGRTWSHPRDITDQLIVEPHWQEWSPVHTGIQLQFGVYQGRLVVPVRCYCPETDLDEHSLKYQFNGVIYSDDGGETWIPGGRSESRVGECSIVERADGSVYANHRTSAIQTRNLERLQNISADGGVTFSPLTSSGIGDVRCHAGLAVLNQPGGARLFLLSNVQGSNRSNLTINISNDEGETWSSKKTLEAGFAAYSDLAVLPDRTIICVYETGENTSRQHLAVARFNLSWLEQPDDISNEELR